MVVSPLTNFIVINMAYNGNLMLLVFGSFRGLELQQ